jgi:hypothetical protein
VIKTRRIKWVGHVARMRDMGNLVLTPWIRVVLEELIVSQLVKKFPAFYKNRMFITRDIKRIQNFTSEKLKVMVLSLQRRTIFISIFINRV